METHPRERSLFWPIVLIGVGIIWLLANFNLVPDFNWAALWRLWPLALIAAGLDMLFGRSRAVVSALIGLLTVGAAVALLVVGPRLGLTPAAPEVKTERFSEPLDGATSAEVTLNLAEFPTHVSALPDSNNLIDAELTHAGKIDFEVSGSAERQVSLGYHRNLEFFFLDFPMDAVDWRIGLSPRVPLLLRIDAGSGSADLVLTELALSELRIDGGSGSLALTLPAADEFYEVRLDGGSGAQTVEVPTDAAGLMNYEGGSGNLRINVADSAAVRVEVQASGSGQVRMPASWEQVENGDEDEGVWQSATFADSEDRQFVIVVRDVGSGSIEVGN